MLDPVGPLPRVVYRRRRAVAVIVLIVVLSSLVLLVASLTGGEPEPESRQSATTAPAPAGERRGSDDLTFGDEDAEVAAAARPARGLAADSGPAPATPPPPTSAAPPPADGAAATPATPVEPPPLEAGAPCPDPMVAIAAEPAQPEFRVGSKPVLRLAVASSAPAPCTRDLDAALQELLVLAADGATRLWSSNDCFPGDTDDVRLLAPGERLTFDVRWAGRTSEPGCAVTRAPLPAGDYLLIAKLGPLTSAPTPFRLVA